MKPLRFPKKLRIPRPGRAGYTATFIGLTEADGTATWNITQKGKLVGRMYEGSAYGWGRPRFSLTKLVWAGPFPMDSSDPKSPNYGMCFDGGPFSSYQECLEAFAKSADRLTEWRRTNAG